MSRHTYGVACLGEQGVSGSMAMAPSSRLHSCSLTSCSSRPWAWQPTWMLWCSRAGGFQLKNIVTFGYPLPNGQVSAALRQRVRGTLVNVVPAECWQQWGGNFLLRGVENLPVSWAPAHADWPRLSPHGPEVTALGALLGDQGEARRMRALTQLRQPRSGEAPLVQWVWDNLCEHMQRFDPAGVFDRP